MGGNNGVLVSPDQVVKWQAELADHDARSRALRRMIDAAKVILDADGEVAAEGQSLETKVDEPPEKPGEKNFMGTINQIVNESAVPISKGTLKEILRERGFESNQVDGTYFYVALRKLHGADRITIQKNGNLAKGTRQ